MKHRSGWLAVVVSLGLASLSAQERTGEGAKQEKEYRFHPIAELLPPLEEQRRLARARLIPALAHAIAHVPVVMRQGATLPGRARELLGLRLDIEAPTHALGGKLLDGREVFVVATRPDPETVKRRTALAVHDPVDDSTVAVVLPMPTMYDQWWPFPPLQQADLDRDGRMELVLTVHHHNGTVEDWDARHYLRVDGDRLVADLVLRDAMKHVWPPYPESLVRQLLLADEAGRLRVVTWYEDVADCEVLAPLGFLVVERARPGAAYVERERTAWITGAEWSLAVARSDFRPD